MSKEEHPYIKKHSDFTRQWKFLIIGTFPPKRGCKERTDLFPFFYGNKGSLWDIINETGLYPDYDFKSIENIKEWQEKYSIGITDIITQCKRKPRKECSPADSNLVVDFTKDLNTELKKYLLNNIDCIQKLYFTSGSEDENSNSAYWLFLKLMDKDIRKIKEDKIVKLPSPSGEFLRTVFSKAKSNFGLKQYFFDFLTAKFPEGLIVAKETFQLKSKTPKTRVNKKGVTVPNTTKRFPNCPSYPSIYRLEKYKELLASTILK